MLVKHLFSTITSPEVFIFVQYYDAILDMFIYSAIITYF